MVPAIVGSNPRRSATGRDAQKEGGVMPKEKFSETTGQSIGLHWGDRHTQVSVNFEGRTLFADLDYSEIDRLIKALRRAKKARLRDYQE